MSSLVLGYQYDIFISYRQNDNRSGWVTEFVRNLNEELAATIKDPVSVYFDSNPHDGLHENHDVDDSLREKLKSIIFIPILSQTYCDTRCFAWKHEFLVFRQQAAEDSLGLKVKVGTGNVSSRILPICIHELDPSDKHLIESELGSVLRGIEFIYEHQGISRPLKPSEEDAKANLKHTYYRDQIAKVARAVKEILFAARNPSSSQSTAHQPIHRQVTATSRKRIALLAAMVALIGILSFTYYYFDGFGQEISRDINKSIAVLPFVNMSDSKEQEYFSDGLTEEVLNRLAALPQLKVMARTSSFAFKGKNLPIQKIADSLGVSYVVEGSVRRAEQRIKVTVQLIRSSDGTHIWSKTYDQILEDIFRIQEDIASNVARTLDIYLDEGKKEMMFYVGTRSVDAYENFLQGKSEFIRVHSPKGGSLWKANAFFNKALQYDSTFAAAYWYQHDAYMHALLLGSSRLFASEMEEELNPQDAYSRMNQLIDKAIQYMPDTSIQNLYKLTRVFYSENWTNLRIYSNKFLNNPAAPKIMAYSETVLAPYSLILLGKGKNLYNICSQAVSFDPMQPTIWQRGLFAALSAGMVDEAIEFNERAKQAVGEMYGGESTILMALGRYSEIPRVDLNFGRSHVAIAYCKDGQFDKARSIADSLYSVNPFDELLIRVYDELNDKEKANRIASEIDKLKMGNIKLALLLTASKEDHLIFDLKSTPNFAKRLQEAGIEGGKP